MPKKKQQNPTPEQAQRELTKLLDEHMAKPTPGSKRAAETCSALASDKNQRAVMETCQAAEFAQRRGDDPLKDAEDMLTSQAQTLDHLFHQFAALAQVNLRDDRQSSLAVAERLMGLALRCQKQSAHSIKALSDLKNPKRTLFIKRQQNLLQLEQAQIEQTLKQIGANNDATVDTRSPREAAKAYPEAPAMEIEHRPQDC